MSTTTKEKPATAPAKAKEEPGKRPSALKGAFTSLKKRLFPAVERATAYVRKRLLPAVGKGFASAWKGLRKGLPALKKVLPGRKAIVSAARKVRSFLEKHGRRHVDFLGKLSVWLFVPAVGLWTAVIQAALVPIAALLTLIIFRPLGIAVLFEPAPIVAMTDALTRWTYEIPFLGLGWNSLSAVNHFVLAALLLPAACTVIAQLVPLDTLARVLPKKRWRIAASLALVGVLYFLTWGAPVLLIAGAVVGIPLVWTYLHWRKKSSAVRACLITGGVHAVANAIVVLIGGLFGGA